VTDPRPAPSRFGAASDMLLLAALALLLGARAHAFSGFPKGYDAFGHVSKVHLILSTFPHVNWNEAWYMGVPSFRGSYPPLYHLLIAVLVWASGASISRAIVLVGAVCVLVQTLAVYGTVRVVVSNRLAALTAGLLWVISPTLWSQLARDGFYPRMLGLAFACLAVFGAVLHVRRPTRLRFVGTMLAVGASLSSHPIAGLSTAVVVGALLLAAPGLDRPARLRRAAGIVAAVSGLAAYFYLPFVVGYQSQLPFAPGKAMPLAELVKPVHRSAIDSLPPVMLVLAIALGAFALLRHRRLRGSPGASRYDWPLRVGAVCGAASLAWLVYAISGSFAFLNRHDIYGLQPKDVLIYMAWMLSIAVGVLFGAMLGDEGIARPWPRQTIAVAVPVAVLLCLAVTVPQLPHAKVDFDTAATRAKMDLLPPDATGHAYRIGAAIDGVTEWLNAVTLTPQIRGYQSQAILHLDWQHWLEASLKQPTFSPQIRDFLFDWNAVRWIYAGPGQDLIAPVAADRTLFEPVASLGGKRPLATFRYRGAGPILSATSAATVLVIGDDASYDRVLRSLAPSDTDSQRVIPVRGGPFLDAYTPAQLRGFEEVMLYGAGAHDPAQAAALLSAYVGSGGGLVVEAGTPSSFSAELARQAGGPIPVAGWAETRLGPEWGFQAAPGSLADGLDLTRFGPPRSSAGVPWVVAAGTRVRPGASAVISAGSRPVVVTERFGSGSVVWSGLDLPSLVTQEGNATESALMARLLLAAARAGSGTLAAGTVSYRNPESRGVRVRSGSGVLFKENETRNWHAFVDGAPAPIYRAGPDMMFVPLDPKEGPVTVDFRFGLTPEERLGFGLTFLTLLVLALYAAGVRRRVSAGPPPDP
jgi:6-pyruvoyl-tetrahydropterin synthase related domain